MTLTSSSRHPFDAKGSEGQEGDEIVVRPLRQLSLARLRLRRRMMLSAGFKLRMKLSIDRPTLVAEISLSISLFVFSSRSDKISAAANEISADDIYGKRFMSAP